MKVLIRSLLLSVFVLQSVSAYGGGEYVWDIDPQIDWSGGVGFSIGLPVQAYSVAGDHSLVAINSRATNAYRNDARRNGERVVQVWYWNDEFRRWETPQDMPVYLTRDPQAPESEEFGMSISIDGARIAVGAPDWNNNKGAVYVFERSENGGWRATTRIEERYRGFGRVKLQGDLMVVGSLEPENQPVYVYRFAHNRWTKAAELYGDTAYMGFGRSLDIDGDRIAVGSHYEGNNTGAVYIYKHNSGAWELEQKLASRVSEGYFGASLDLEGNRLVIGAPGGESGGVLDKKGVVYVYQRNANSWSEVATIIPTNNYQASDLFGYSAQISPDGFVAVGAPGVECHNNRCDVDGAIYLFREVIASSWKQVAHVAATSIGDAVLLQDGMLWTSGDTGVSHYTFEVKPDSQGGQRESAADTSDSNSGGGVDLWFLLGLLFAAGLKGRLFSLGKNKQRHGKHWNWGCDGG